MVKRLASLTNVVVEFGERGEGGGVGVSFEVVYESHEPLGGIVPGDQGAAGPGGV